MANTIEEAGLELGDLKATEGMKDALSNLLRLLQCPLCDKLFDKPTTLASCAHSFCVKCIDSYCCDAWVCPVEGCGMPLSITGAHRGSYRKINPQLSQTIESASIIIKSLNKAQDDWWKKTKISENLIHEEDSEGEHESDEEEMVDLQMHEKKEIESETFF